jgi:spore coat polysaccharide biosynthesis protein SpsF
MKNKVATILCARMSSSRLPGKVLADIGGKTALQHNVERLRSAKCVDPIIIATSSDSEDDPIASLAAELKVPCYRGSLHNVTERMNNAVNRYAYGAGYVYRAMSDQPFFDWKMFDEMFAYMKLYGWDFILPLSFQMDPIYGAGQSPWSYRAWTWNVATSKNDELEHPGMCIRRNIKRFHYGLVELPKWVWRGHRLELDTAEDLALFRLIYNAWDRPEQPPLDWVVNYLDHHRQVSAINAGVIEKTGTFTSFTADEILQWHKDYKGRTTVWSNFSNIMAQMLGQELRYKCEKCEGVLMVEKISKGNLIMKCVKCGEKRTFYSKKE